MSSSGPSGSSKSAPKQTWTNDCFLCKVTSHGVHNPPQCCLRCRNFEQIDSAAMKHSREWAFDNLKTGDEKIYRQAFAEMDNQIQKYNSDFRNSNAGPDRMQALEARQKSLKDLDSLVEEFAKSILLAATAGMSNPIDDDDRARFLFT
jgi:hypothetical protein